jgi:hypothetical protein
LFSAVKNQNGIWIDLDEGEGEANSDPALTFVDEDHA